MESNIDLMCTIVQEAGSFPKLEERTGLSRMTLWRISKTGKMRFDTARMLNDYMGEEVFKATHCTMKNDAVIDFDDAAAVAKWNEEHPLDEEFLYVFASKLGDRKWD